MLAPTHIAAGLLTTTGAFSLFSVPLHNDLPAIGATILGSLLPDIDSPRSSLGRLVPFISVPIERKWGHRTVTHCLLALLALSVIALPLCLVRPTCYAALIIGYASHVILADCATKSGCPLFLPHPAVAVLPGNDKYRFRTGALGEWILLSVLTILLAAVFPISRMGGIWRALRYLSATQSMAYSDYREATTETILNFKGHWRESRQPVSGEALILDATKSQFVIDLNGHPVSYGEQGDILPDRSRVRTTRHPIKIDTLAVHGETFDQILKNIPHSAFISGRLESSVSFIPNLRAELPQNRHQSIQNAVQHLHRVHV